MLVSRCITYSIFKSWNLWCLRYYGIVSWWYSPEPWWLWAKDKCFGMVGTCTHSKFPVIRSWKRFLRVGACSWSPFLRSLVGVPFTCEYIWVDWIELNNLLCTYQHLFCWHCSDRFIKVTCWQIGTSCSIHLNRSCTVCAGYMESNIIIQKNETSGKFSRTCIFDAENKCFQKTEHCRANSFWTDYTGYHFIL